MADENRMITFQYARNNWDAYKKQTIPDSLECMTKTDLDSYLDADLSGLTGYANNQLIPRAGFIPNIPDTCLNTGSGFNGQVFTMARQPDGKILIGGSFFEYYPSGVDERGFLRINPDGSKDTSFNKGTGTSNTVRKLILQDDGKIILVGNFTSYNGYTCNGIIRLNSDGTRDTSFNMGTGFGTPSPTTPPSFDPYKIVIQPDGKYLVVGFFNSYNGTAVTHIARINTDGSLDTSFNPGTGFGTSFDWNKLFDTKFIDGYLYVTGTITTYKGVACPSAIKIDSSGNRVGAFNPAFDGSNTYVTTIGKSPYDGSLIITSFTTVGNVTTMAKYNSDGSMNTLISNGFNYWIDSWIEVNSNEFVICGRFTQFNDGSGWVVADAIVKIKNGIKDTTFNYANGFDGGGYGGYDFIKQSNGKLIVGGWFSKYQGYTVGNIARINTDGSLDTCYIGL